MSFFAAANATLNYGPRVLFTMAHDGLLPIRATNTNRRGAPYRAILCYAIVWLAVLTYVLVSGVSQGTAFGNLGSLAGILRNAHPHARFAGGPGVGIPPRCRKPLHRRGWSWSARV